MTDARLRTIKSRKKKHQPIVNDTSYGFEGAIEKARCDKICRKFEVNVWRLVSYLDELQHMQNGLNDMQKATAAQRTTRNSHNPHCIRLRPDWTPKSLRPMKFLAIALSRKASRLAQTAPCI